MRQGQKDFWAGLIFLVVAGAFFIQYDGLEGVSRVFPEMLITLIGGGGIYFVAKGIVLELRHKNPNAKPQEKVEQGLDLSQLMHGSGDEKTSWLRIIYISVLSIIFVFAIEYIGFFVSTFVFLVLAYALLGSKNSRYNVWLRAFMFAVPLTAGIWLLFVKLLAVPTPAGMFF